LAKEFQQQGHTAADIDAAIRDLIEKKLMVALDDRVLALATEEPLAELMVEQNHPLGELRPWMRSPRPGQ
jgi:hypothetical protein